MFYVKYIETVDHEYVKTTNTIVFKEDYFHYKIYTYGTISYTCISN